MSKTCPYCGTETDRITIGAISAIARPKAKDLPYEAAQTIRWLKDGDVYRLIVKEGAIWREVFCLTGD